MSGPFYSDRALVKIQRQMNTLTADEAEAEYVKHDTEALRLRALLNDPERERLIRQLQLATGLRAMAANRLSCLCASVQTRVVRPNKRKRA